MTLSGNVRLDNRGQYLCLYIPTCTSYLTSSLPYLHSIPMMCASLSCPSSSGSQADRQPDRTDRQTAQLSPPRCGHQQRMREWPVLLPCPALPFPSFPFPSLPFPPVDELDLTCFVWALPQNVIICVIAYPWMRERASTPHYLTCIT